VATFHLLAQQRVRRRAAKNAALAPGTPMITAIPDEAAVVREEIDAVDAAEEEEFLHDVDHEA